MVTDSRFTIDGIRQPLHLSMGLFHYSFRTSKATTYIIAFVIGSILDSLEQSGGSHTIACLLTVLQNLRWKISFMDLKKKTQLYAQFTHTC